MALRGRGRGYTLARAAAEAALEPLFASRWPAALPFATSRVRRLDYAWQAGGVPAEFGPLRIGFASDLHAGPTTPMQTVRDAFRHLRDFAPHVLLLGGDFVLFDAAHARVLAPLIASVEAPLGRFAVLGNHDLWADEKAITSTLEAVGVEVLVNRTARPRPFLTIGGLDDAWAGEPRYDGAFDGAGPVHVLLMHGPDHAPRLDGRSFDVALCGHTHGGQVCLPGGAPLLYPTGLCRRFPSGSFELPGGLLLVSRGVGHSELPLRLFAPPDVICLTLMPA